MKLNRKLRVQIAAACVIAVTALYFLAFHKHHEKAVPQQLWGYWITDAQGYENRYLELDDRYVLIGVNEEDMPELQRVSRVDCQARGEQLNCTIYSSSPEAEYQLDLDYQPANKGELRIKNQRGVVWKRQVSSTGL
jgi:hypothetical protein